MASIAAATPAYARPPSGATKLVEYLGVTATVPASWPVIDLSGKPGCIRYDVHAAYLGEPSELTCPSHLVGHVETLQLTSQAGAVAGSTSAQRVSTGQVHVSGGTASHPDLLVDDSSSSVVAVVSAGSDVVLAKRVAASVKWSASAPRPTQMGSSGAATKRSAGAPSAASRTVTGFGFDTCAAPSSSAMSAWLASPYRSINIYIGGADRGCAQANLSASWVSTVAAQGWSLIPTYVGLQAPCSSEPNRIDPANATTQGRQAADDAASIMGTLGLPAAVGNPVYLDMENYNTSDSACVAAVKSFTDAWTLEMHTRGYLSGIYGSAASMITNLVRWTSDGGYHVPDAIWYAHWNDNTSVYGDAYVPDGLWNGHQRIHQYHGGHGETYAGVTINIDNNALDAPTSPGSGAGDGQFVSVNETGWVFKIAGGAPLYVSTWDHVGGPQPTTPISLAQLDALPTVPRDGTLISAQPSGRVFIVAGGAPLYVSNWDNIGGSRPSIAVDDAAVENAGGGAPWNHLRNVPSDGFINGHASGRVFRVVGGHPYYIGSWDPFGGPQPVVDVDDYAIDACDHLNCNPFGSLDSATNAGDRIRVAGWAMDPNDTNPIGIHVYVDGAFAGAGQANRSRPDVDAVFHRGPKFGYDFTVPAKAGTHQVCTYGLNTGPGGNDLVGCASVAVTHAPHVTVKPSVSGTVRVGNTVTCRPGTWQYTNSFTYRWLRDGKAITSATRTSYRIPESAYRHKLSCEVTGHNKVATSRATSASRGIAAGPALKPTTKPGISGSSTAGKRLTVSTGRWTPLATAIHYQWLRDGKTINGATKNTYTSRASDRKRKISCLVSASRIGWTTGRFTTPTRTIT